QAISSNSVKDANTKGVSVCSIKARSARISHHLLLKLSVAKYVNWLLPLVTIILFIKAKRLPRPRDIPMCHFIQLHLPCLHYGAIEKWLTNLPTLALI